ncbi:hypothetical protein ACTFIR_009020 [Dictyostelium discoideum]
MDTLTKNSSDLSQMLDPEYFKSQSSGDSNNQNNNNQNNNNNDINNNNNNNNSNNNNIKDSPKKKTVRFTSQVEFVEPSQSQNNNNNNNNNQNNNNNNNNNSSPDINMFDINNNNNNNNIFDVFQDDIPNSFMLSVIDGSQQIIFNEEDDSEEIQQSLSQQQQLSSSSLDNYLLDSSLQQQQQQQKQLSIELRDDEYYQSISLPIWDAVTSQDPKMVMKFGKIKRKRGIVIDNRRKKVPDITIDDLMKKDLLRIGDTLCYCIGGVNHFALLLRDGYIEYDSLRLPSVHAFVIHVLSNLEKNKKFRWFSPWDSVSVRGKSLNFIRSIFQSKFYKGGDNIIYQYEPTTTTTPIVKKQESPIKSSSPQKNILKESPSPSKNLKRTLDNTDNSQNLNNNSNNNNNNNNEKDITVKNSKDDDDDKIIKKQKTDDNIENNGKQQMAIDDESTQSIQPVLIDDESTQKIIEQKDENEKAEKEKVEKVEKEDEEATQAMVDNLNNQYDNSPTIPMTTMECVRANLNTGFRDDDEDENENENDNENKNENKKVTSKNNSESTLQNSNSDLPIIYSSPNYQQNKFQTPKTPAPSPSSTQDHFNRPTIEQPSSPYKSPSKSQQQQQQQASQKLSQQQQSQHQSPSKSQEQQASPKLSQQQQQQQRQSPSKSQEQQASQKSSQQHQSPSKSQEQQASQKSSQQQSPSKSQVSQQSLSHQLTQLQQSPAKSQEQQQSPAKSQQQQQQQQQQSTSSLLNNTISPKQSQNNTNADSPYSSISLHQPIFVTPSPRGSNMGSIVSNGGGGSGGGSSGSSSISGSISGSISSSSDGGLNHQQSQSSQSSQNSSSSSSSSSIFSIPAGQKPPTPSPLPSIQPSLPIQNTTTTIATNQSSQLGSSSSNNINSNSNNQSNTYDELRSFQIPQSQNNFDDSQQTLDVDQQPSQYLSPKKVSQHSQQKNNQLSQQKSLSQQQQLPSQQQLSSQQQQQQQQPIIIEKENISSPLNKSKIELPIIIATGLTGLMQLHIHSLCSAIGGKLVTEFNDQVTHVVCSTLDGDGGKDNLAKRTIKYQMGIGRGGLWLVSFDWILESLNENQWVNESEFEIQGDSIGLGSPLKSRQQLFETKRLFYGQSFYLAGEFQSPSRQEIISVIKSSGGIVLDQLPPKPQNLNEMLQSTCTVICHPLLSSIDQSLIQTIYLSTKHIPISFSWIFDSISKYKLLPKDNYYQYPNSNNGKFKINDPSVAY